MLDERGRIAARFNAVDVAVAMLLLLLIPLAFGAFLMFRTPPATLQMVVPATIVEGPNQRLEIDGNNLRPFMRVTLGSTPANSFVLGSTKYAVIDLPTLKPGTYDVVLFDYEREVARLPHALTVAPLAADVELEIEGVFKAPSDAALAYLRTGAKLPTAQQAVAEILNVGAPRTGELPLRIGDEVLTIPQKQRDLPATLRAGCQTVQAPDGTARCVLVSGDERVVIAPGALITWGLTDGPIVFQITSARLPRGDKARP